jgi:hypothetical protein
VLNRKVIAILHATSHIHHSCATFEKNSMNKITFLNINDFKVLKIIRIEDNSKWNYFAGYLYYTRKLKPKYKAENKDYIDDMILASIKKVYPDSRLVINKDIMFENQLDDILGSFSGKKDIDFKISFIPNVPYDRMYEISDKEIYAYTFEFNFNRISVWTDKEKLKYINNHLQAEIPFDKIDDFNHQIRNIEFKK